MLIDDEQHRRLEAEAARRGVSVAVLAGAGLRREVTAFVCAVCRDGRPVTTCGAVRAIVAAPCPGAGHARAGVVHHQGHGVDGGGVAHSRGWLGFDEPVAHTPNP